MVLHIVLSGKADSQHEHLQKNNLHINYAKPQLFEDITRKECEQEYEPRTYNIITEYFAIDAQIEFHQRKFIVRQRTLTYTIISQRGGYAMRDATPFKQFNLESPILTTAHCREIQLSNRLSIVHTCKKTYAIIEQHMAIADFLECDYNTRNLGFIIAGIIRRIAHLGIILLHEIQLHLKFFGNPPVIIIAESYITSLSMLDRLVSCHTCTGIDIQRKKLYARILLDILSDNFT